MKRILLFLLIALVGIGLIAYPAVSNYLFILHASTAIQAYDANVDKNGEAAIQAAMKQAVDYNDDLKGTLHDPFLPGSGMVMDDNYKNVLNLQGDGEMGYINIPKINVKLPIYHGTADDILQNGVGHLEGSSLPIGGIGTHSVLTGHTGLAHAKLFTDLTKLAIGDTFYLHILDQTLAYQVDQIKVVQPDDTSNLKIDPQKDYCTLVTCTPYGINDHRLQVRGVRVPYTPAAEQAQAAQASSLFPWFDGRDTVIGLAVGAAAVACIIIYIIVRRKKKKEKSGSRKTGNGRKRKIKKKFREKYWWYQD